MKPPPGLLPDESVREVLAVSFHGSMASSARAIGMLGSNRVRIHAFGEWRSVADEAGFPAAGPDMVVGVTDRRLLVWRPSFWAARPSDLVGAIALSRVREVGVAQRGLVTVVTFALDSGLLVGVESLRPVRARRLAAAVRSGAAT